MIKGLKTIDFPARLNDSLKPLLRRDISVNLTAWAQTATPNDIADGLTWYPKARGFAIDKAKFYQVSLQTVCGVISALSPAISWQQNLLNTETVLQAIKQSYEPENVTVTTYNANKHKAFSIAKQDAVEFTTRAFAKANKTANFYRNLLGWRDSVTVDRHAISAAIGHNTINLTLARYEVIADAYKLTAKTLGYSPSELQAIVWVVYRRIAGIATRYDREQTS